MDKTNSVLDTYFKTFLLHNLALLEQENVTPVFIKSTNHEVLFPAKPMFFGDPL